MNECGVSFGIVKLLLMSLLFFLHLDDINDNDIDDDDDYDGNGISIYCYVCRLCISAYVYTQLNIVHCTVEVHLFFFFCSKKIKKKEETKYQQQQ